VIAPIRHVFTTLSAGFGGKTLTCGDAGAKWVVPRESGQFPRTAYARFEGSARSCFLDRYTVWL
jgi:hypothetical protein